MADQIDDIQELVAEDDSDDIYSDMSFQCDIQPAHAKLNGRKMHSFCGWAILGGCPED